MNKKPSGQQAWVLREVKKFVSANGYSPTVTDLAESMGLQKTSIIYALKRLEAKGHLELEYKNDRLVARGIFLLGQRDNTIEHYKCQAL